MTRTRYPLVSFRWPASWTRLLEDEIQYRIAHGLGNARLPFVLRDALLNGNAGIERIPSPSKSEPGVRQATTHIGPTLEAHVELMTAHGWKAAEYGRAALYHYLHDYDVYTRPRNLPGCDHMADPLDFARELDDLGQDPS